MTEPLTSSPPDVDAKRTLVRQATILRLLQDTLPVVVWTIDPQGVFLQYEGGGLARIGIKPGEFVGQNIFERFPEDPIFPTIRQVLAGQAKHAFVEFAGRPWETWYVPNFDEQGQIESLTAISLDLSDRRRAESDLQAQLALAERQRQVISAMSTPIIEVWDKVLTLPLVGVLDSGRAAAVMDNLLVEIGEKGARFAILELTGVDAVDSSTASYLIKLIQAIRLLGAEGIITGIQPNVAQTMVTLGLDLGTIVTLANLRDALRFCMARMRNGGSAR